MAVRVSRLAAFFLSSIFLLLVADVSALELSGSTEWVPEGVRDAYVAARTRVMAPVMRVATAACLAMSVMLVAEVVYMAAVSVGVKAFRWRPEKRYKWEEIREDEEVGSLNFPMVLVQIPMYNEKEVYKLSIGAACGLAWPSDRLIIQVLDDSTDPTVKMSLSESTIQLLIRWCL